MPTAYDNWKLSYPKHWDNPVDTCNECDTELDEGEDCPKCFPVCNECMEKYNAKEGEICKACQEYEE